MIAKSIILNNEWVDINAQLGIDKTETIFVQNKSAGSVYLWPKDTVPEKNTVGTHLKINESITISTENESLYARGLGEIHCHVVTAASSVSLAIPEGTTLPVSLVVPEGDTVPVNLVMGAGETIAVNQLTITSTNNSTSTNLAANQTFTGVADDVSGVGTILVGVFGDVASATQGLKFQTSPNGVDWYNIDQFTFLNVTPYVYSMSPVFRFFRIVYINGAAPTTKFFIQTFYKQGYVKPSSHRAADVINGENDVELMKAILTAMMPNGSYTNIHATAGGNLKVSLEEYEPSIGKLPVEPLSGVTTARKIPSSTISTRVTLTAGCKRISIRARGCDIRFAVGDATVTANASTSHFIAQDERLDIAVSSGASIAAVRESLAVVDGILEITELG